MIATIIYDSTGQILNVIYGTDTPPTGIKTMTVDIPENVMSVDAIDMSEEKPVFRYVPQASMDSVNATVSQAIAEIRNMMESLMVPATIFAETLDDERALKVQNLYPEWSGDGVFYNKGDRVRYRDGLWKVITNHKSQDNWTPTYAPSLFVKVIDEVYGGGYPEWEQPGAANSYKKGDRARHNDVLWESLVDANVWEPGTAGTEDLWREVTI